MCLRSGCRIWPGSTYSPSAVKPKPVSEAVVRKSSVEGAEVKVSLVFEHFSCEVIAFILPECVTGVDVVSERGMFAVSSDIKHCESARHASPACVNAHCRWAPV